MGLTFIRAFSFSASSQSPDLVSSTTALASLGRWLLECWDLSS